MSAERISEERLAEIRGIAQWQPPDDSAYTQLLREVLAELLSHADAQQAEIDRLKLLREADRKREERILAEIDASEVRRVTRSNEQHARIEALEAQAAELRALLDAVWWKPDNEWTMADRERTVQVLTDTEAVAREHDRRLRLDLMREIERSAQARETGGYTYYGPDSLVEAFESILAGLEREAGQ